MEFGMFHEFQRRPGQTEAQAFTESFEQVDEAEAAGLDVMWLAELHTSPDRSVLAAPLSIASAIATRTQRMKIGIASISGRFDGKVRLDDGTTVLGVIGEWALVEGHREISLYGGWRAYIAAMGIES